MILRPDQVDFVGQIEAALNRSPHTVLAVAPTGSGKTVCLAALVHQRVGKRVMIVAHRRELLDQISRCLEAWSVEHGMVSPEYPVHRNRIVQVASIQSLINRLADYHAPDFIVVDEAHHAILRSSWGKLFRAWPQAHRLGVTATPERLSGEGLRDTFASIVIGPSTQSLIELGALSRYRLFAPPVNPAEHVARRAGDFARGDLAVAMNTRTITGDAVAHYRSLACGKRAMVFCVSIAHAEAVAGQFAGAGFAACSIDGKRTLTDRREILERFTDGRIQVLTSCDLVSEGFDLPAVEVAILLRPTQSLALHLQQVGRALRPWPGKEAAIILDHAGNTARHGLPDTDRQWSLDGRERRRQSEGEAAPDVKTCPHCFAAVLASVLVCPECAHVFRIVSRDIQQVEGTLTEVDIEAQRRDARRQQGSASTMPDLIALGRARGYRNPAAWARHVFAARQRRS